MNAPYGLGVGDRELHANRSASRSVARTGGAIVATLTLVLTMLYVGTGVAAAQSDEGTQTPVGDLQFSADGVLWADSDADALPPFGGDLAPGHEITRTYFVRNADTRAGTFEVFVGDWSSSANAIYTVRSSFEDREGETYVYYGDDYTEHAFGPAVQNGTVLNSIELAPGQQVQVTDGVGMPRDVGNETQNSNLSPAISWTLRLSEPVDPPAACEDRVQVGGVFSAAGSTGGVSSTSAFGSTGGSVSSGLECSALSMP